MEAILTTSNRVAFKHTDYVHLCTVYKYLYIVYMGASCVFWLDEPGYIHYEVYNHQCAFTSMLEWKQSSGHIMYTK